MKADCTLSKKKKEHIIYFTYKQSEGRGENTLCNTASVVNDFNI